jgi:hypothetical protein
MPDYADDIELIATWLMDRRHVYRMCGPDCLCWKLREIPAIKKAIAELECKKVS